MRTRALKQTGDGALGGAHVRLDQARDRYGDQAEP